MISKEHKMIITVIICALYIFLVVMGMTLIKSGHSTESIFSIPIIDVSVSIRTFIGILFYGLSFLVFTFYVSRLNIGIVVPIVSGLTGLVVAIIGYVFFKENITPGQFVGVAFIVLGTVLVGVFK